MLHTTLERPTRVGDRCVIGHLVHLEGCTIEDDALVGNAAMVLHRSVVHSWSVVAANSVVLYDVDVPSGALAAGSPAVIKEGRAQPQMITDGVESLRGSSDRGSATSCGGSIERHGHASSPCRPGCRARLPTA